MGSGLGRGGHARAPHLPPQPPGPARCVQLWKLLEYEPEERLSAEDALRHPFVAAAAQLAPPAPDEAAPTLESSASRSADRQLPVVQKAESSTLP